MNNFIKSKLTIKKINITLLISLIPLILAGFYKNGIKLYYLKYINIINMLKPLLLSLIGYLLGIIVNIIYDKIKKKHTPLKTLIQDSFYPYYGLLIASLISINTPYYIFIPVTFILLLINKIINNKNINIVALTVLIIILLMNITNNFTYLNIYEQTNNLHLEPLDYFLGMGSGGINTTNILLLLLSIIILFKEEFYKKEIPIVGTTVYLILTIIYAIYKQDILLILDSIFSNNILFSFIYVATIFEYSPITKKGTTIYSILLGLITFILYLVYPSLASLGGILLSSICIKYINKIIER